MRFKKISHEEMLKAKPGIRELALRKRTPCYALFDSIRSLHNVGALFRTSDGAAVSKVFLTGITGCPPHKDIDKTALGATDVIPWEYCRRGKDIVLRLKSQGVLVVALELTHQSVSYSAMKYTFPVCLVVGNEVDGVSQEILDLCDYAISIPMLGRAHSLNVATAYGIALFEILKQYQTHAKA